MPNDFEACKNMLNGSKELQILKIRRVSAPVGAIIP